MAGATKRVAQRGQLLVPADKRARRRGGLRPQPQQTRRRVLGTARRHRRTGLELGRPREQPGDSCPGEDLSVRGGRLQRPGRGERLPGRPAGVRADERLACVEPDADRCQVADLECGPRSAQRVVLVQLGEPEDAHDRIAGRALGLAAVSANDPREPVQQRVQGLRIVRPDARDEDAHEPAGGSPRRRGGRRGRPVGLLDRQRERRVLASTARSSSRSCSPGSMPSSSTSALRASW